MSQALARGFDRLYTAEHIHKLEKIIFFLALSGFFAHLFLIGLHNIFAFEWSFLQLLSNNYLSAIYTPFSFILFFEVWLLIYYIPQSMTISLNKQYQVVSLIVLRRVFKDIAVFERHVVWSFQNPAMRKILLDMACALVMFGLIFLFARLQDRIQQTASPKDNPSESIQHFIRVKKSMALILTAILAIMAIYSFTHWFYELLLYTPGQKITNVNKIFYKEFFTVLVLFDVTVLIFSILYTSGYDKVFRNAGFITSTVLIRISFSAPRSYNVLFLVVAVLFGLLVLWLYAQYQSKAPDELREMPPTAPEEDDAPSTAPEEDDAPSTAPEEDDAPSTNPEEDDAPSTDPNDEGTTDPKSDTTQSDPA